MKIDKKQEKLILEAMDTEVITVETDSEGKPEPPKVLEEKIENALTKELDEALFEAKKFIRTRQYNQNCNVLIEGLPGSSKTASINSWAAANGIHLVKLNAKDPELEILVNGAPAIDNSDPTQVKLVKAYSNALDKLKEPNTVLFLDELNRQIKEYLRGSLLSLLEERACYGPGEDGMVHFPGLLFTIAAINPWSKSDPGTSKLLPAERRRFQHYVRFDSDKTAALEYVKKHYDKMIIESYNYYKGDINNPDYLEELKEWLNTQQLGIALLKGIWNFNGDDKYAEIYNTGNKLLCQAAITELLAMSFGDKDTFLRKLAKYQFLPADTKALTAALDRYVEMPFEILVEAKEKEFKKKGIDVKLANISGTGSATTSAKPEKPETPVAPVKPASTGDDDDWDDEDDEDDVDVFASRKKKVSKSVEDKKKAIKDHSFEF